MSADLWCSGRTEAPGRVPRKARILTPTEYDQLLAPIPARYRLLIMVDIETGLRWGELIALRPRHIDFLRRTITVEQTIVEVSKKFLRQGRATRRPDLQLHRSQRRRPDLPQHLP